MSERTPRISSKDLIRVLKKLGFVEDRIHGSHVILLNADHSHRVVVPFHQGKMLPIGTLRAIPDDADITVEQLRKLM